MTLFYFCIAWLAGIALAPPLGLPLISFLIAGALFFLFAFTVRKFRIPFLCLAFFLLGGARLSAAQPKPGPSFIGSYLNRSAVFEVVLDEDPIPRGSGFRVRAHVVLIGFNEGEEIRNLEGAILVEFGTPPDGWQPRYGDRAKLSGVLLPPRTIEGFDYAGYLARQGVYGTLREAAVQSVAQGEGNPLTAALFAFRRRALATLRALFPEPEGSLLAGILLGEESSIPVDLQDAFSRTGTSHIVAISGFNISIIAGLFLTFTKRLPRRIPGWLLAAAGIAAYTILVGAAASVVRAAVMGGMAILARQLGRRSHGLTSLAFTGAAMTAAYPWTLWDIGFQLSFAATLGLILYADPLQSGAERWLLRRISMERARGLAGVASEVFLMTIAAQITTLPVMLFYFNSLSLSAFAVNPLVLSVQPMVMIAGGLALLLGMLWLPAGQVLAWAGWAPTAYTIRVVEWGANISALWWPIGLIPPVWIGAYYIALFGSTALSARKMLPDLEWGRTLASKVSAAALPILAAGVFMMWGAYFHRPDGRLHLTMLSAGGGETILVRSPDGGTVLIDAGGDTNQVISELGRILGFGPQRLDWVVVGSAAVESVSALAEIAERFEIGAVLLPAGMNRNSGIIARFLARCEQKHIPIHEGEGGYRLDFDGGASLTVLMQGDSGMILSLEHGMSRWLILDGLDETISRRMLAQGRVPSAQVVLLPLSIKETGTLAEWLRAARPLAGLWPFAEDLGWPEEIDLLRADAHGWVELSTDGNRLWVRVEK